MRLGAVFGGSIAVMLAFGALIWINSLGRSESITESESGTPESTEGAPFRSNPFEDEDPDPPPRVEVEESTDFDFERMALGESRTHKFVVRNVGEGPLKLAQGASTCKCTVGTVGLEELASGESTEIEVTWKPEGLQMAFLQNAIIYTNDPTSRELNLTVRGAVVDWATIFPNSTWRSSSISETEPTQFEFVAVSQVVESFSITNVEASSDLVTIESVTPIPDEELTQYQLALCGYRLRGSLLPEFPIGAINELVTITTDIEQMPEMQMKIESSRIGPYQLVGPGWNGSMRLLQLGRFDAAEGKSLKLSFFAEKLGGDFQFTDVRVEPPVLDVSWEDDPEFESGNRKRIRLTLSTLPDMTPARWVREDPILVTMTTNDPEVPEWGFSVTLQAN